MLLPPKPTKIGVMIKIEDYSYDIDSQGSFTFA